MFGCVKFTQVQTRCHQLTTIFLCVRVHIFVFVARRAEPYACVVAWDQMPPLQIERAAATYWGVHTFGVHCNGYVADKDALWVSKRAADKATYPGLLDNLSAGGLTIDERPGEAMMRELEEEASMDPGVFYFVD